MAFQLAFTFLADQVVVLNDGTVEARGISHVIRVQRDRGWLPNKVLFAPFTGDAPEDGRLRVELRRRGEEAGSVTTRALEIQTEPGAADLRLDLHRWPYKAGEYQIIISGGGATLVALPVSIIRAPRPARTPPPGTGSSGR